LRSTHCPFRPFAALTVVNAKRADDEQDEAVLRSRSMRAGDRDDCRCLISAAWQAGRDCVDYREFVAFVEERSGVTHRVAKQASCLVLRRITSRINRGERKDIAALLPKPLDQCIPLGERIAKFDLDRFIRRVAEELHVDRATAGRAAAAVLAALFVVIGDREFAEMRVQLPQDFKPLIKAAVRAAT
jgi:uncharacterized protein (DUF2267 family)